MKRFNVLLVIPGLMPKGIGGTGLSTLYLASGLKNKGHNVYLMCKNSPMTKEFIERGIKVLPGAIDKRSPWGIYKGSRDIKRCIIDKKIEIVHCQTAVPVVMAFLACRWIKSRKPKIIWHCRGVRALTYFIVGRIFNFMTDFVIANCDFAKNRLIRHGLWPAKVKTIYNCLNMEIPDNPQVNSMLLREIGINFDTFIIGTVSRLDPDRGVKYFLKAASLVIKEVKNVKFLIIGSGRIERKLRNLATELGIEQYAHFLGARRDLNGIYPAMNLFVNPCPLDTGTSNVITEAMAFAKPVVAVNRGGVPELVESNVTGILVPPKNSTELARAILYLIRNPKSASNMGLKGNEQVMKRWTQERLTCEIEEIYRSLVN